MKHDCSPELYHHGIKGMKWGVRRYQNKDGSLTGVGRKRYQDDPEVQKSKATMKADKKAMNKAYTDYLNKGTSKSWDTYRNSKKQYDASKFNYKTNKEAARLRENGKIFEKKSKHRLGLEEQYRKKGLTPEQAQAAANNRIRTEKILAATAAMTVAACAAYAVNSRYKDRIDGIIKSGEKLQRIEMRDTGGQLNDMFFVSKGKHDSKRYKGLLGMTRQRQVGEAYLMKLQANSDIKVASKDKAAQVFGDLYKNDSNFRSAVANNVSKHFSGKNKVRDINNLSSRNLKKMYENFNSGLIDIRNDGSGADKKFYDALKKAGYGAIQDINDMKFSGYKAKNPLIIFDNSGGKIAVKSMNKMDNMTLSGLKELSKATGEAYAEKFLRKSGYVVAAGAGAAAAGMYVNDKKNEKTKQKQQ